MGRIYACTVAQVHERRGNFGRSIAIMFGVLSGLTAVALILGVFAGRLTTTTRDSAAGVAAAVTMTVALIGGLVVEPHLRRLACKHAERCHDADASSR